MNMTPTRKCTMKSETPETDAKEIETRKPIRWSSGYGQTTLEGYVPAEFARKLERERNQLRSEMATLKMTAQSTFPEASAPEQISGINTARLVGAGNSSNA
jgi:hypothetical protein